MKKTQKGITLIALVITIIVMLILVGVTINIVMNSGLFGKAQEAKIETSLEKEIVQTAALGYLDNNGYIDLTTFIAEEDGIEGYELTDNTTYVTATKGENTFYITNEGGILTELPEVKRQRNYTIHNETLNFTVQFSLSSNYNIAAQSENNR